MSEHDGTYLRCLYLTLNIKKKQARTIPSDDMTVRAINRPRDTTLGTTFSVMESGGGSPPEEDT